MFRSLLVALAALSPPGPDSAYRPLGIEVGPLDAALELGDQLARDPVAALGTVQRQPRHAVGDVVLDGAHRQTGSARSMIAPVSTPPGSVP